MIKRRLTHLSLTLTALAAALAGQDAQAAITCSLSVPAISQAYIQTRTTTQVVQSSVTLTCTRGAAGDATSRTVTIAANNGLYAQGNNNRGASGANRVLYDLYRDSACTLEWRGGGRSISATVNFTSTADFSPRSTTVNFWSCMPGNQTTVPTGTFVDTVTLTPNVGATASLSMTIRTSAACNITTLPAAINFNYTSFQAAALTVNSNFGVSCTTALPYTMALDATTGTILGLNYTLALSAASATGIGVAQTHTVVGTMPGGQSGTCNSGTGCTSSQVRTLTITY